MSTFAWELPFPAALSMQWVCTFTNHQVSFLRIYQMGFSEFNILENGLSISDISGVMQSQQHLTWTTLYCEK